MAITGINNSSYTSSDIIGVWANLSKMRLDF